MSDDRPADVGSTVLPRIMRDRADTPKPNPHDDYQRQAAAFFAGTPTAATPSPTGRGSSGSADGPPVDQVAMVVRARPSLRAPSQRFAAGTTYAGRGGQASTPASPTTSAQPPVPTSSAPPPAPSTAPSHIPVVPAAVTHPVQHQLAAGAPSTANNVVAQWLADPAHVKLAIGAVAVVIGAITLLAGDPGVKLAGLVILVIAWLTCFRQGYHENATLRVQTRLPADELIHLAPDLARTLRGPMSSIEFNGTAGYRLDFTVKGVTWSPLDFHVAVTPDPSGWTFLATEIDSFTWHRYRVYFLPVPFSKSIQGWGLYKSFGDRLLTAVRERDPSAIGEFHKRPPT
ncbi:hypothetical protein [Mycobacterium sp. 141]|uniref:hypothetical protein n=1 Tax=Mycobacterium sp. 141 TaxID=1120797 RepID=UPI00039EA3C3|nr:hypothetical protein [Mycobacterium sp. 141]